MQASEFIAYLEAKAALDRRSFNPKVAALFFKALLRFAEAEVVDLGSGTGAMLRHVAVNALNPSLILTGVEQDRSLIEAAPVECQKALLAAGWQIVDQAPLSFTARQGGRVRKFRFVLADGLEFAPKTPCQAVCAHTFLDLVPLSKALGRVKSLLVPGGVFYATCNYDGSTTLFPQSANPAFEAGLLAHYDRSMELRRCAGEATGGALCGRRLHQALWEGGWEIVGFGSSDWNLTPVQGAYLDADAEVLEALLAMIYREGEGLDSQALAEWYRERLASLKAGQLGLIVHQLDFVALRP